MWDIWYKQKNKKKHLTDVLRKKERIFYWEPRQIRQKLENENVTPLWIKWICCIWQSLEEKIVLMSELMSRSREIKVVHNFQQAAPMFMLKTTGHMSELILSIKLLNEPFWMNTPRELKVMNYTSVWIWRFQIDGGKKLPRLFWSSSPAEMFQIL